MNLMRIDYSKALIKHYKNSYFWGDYLNITYFEVKFLNKYLNNNILQHLVKS